MVRLKEPDLLRIGFDSCCFNSLMVRLKVSRAFTVVRSLFCFNSLMVRLKDFTGSGGAPAATKFQFPNGSIKRNIQQALPIISISFNSLMVRLKVAVIDF